MNYNFSSFFTPQHTKRGAPGPQQHPNYHQASQHVYSDPYRSPSNVYSDPYQSPSNVYNNPYSSPGGQYAYNPYHGIQQNQLYEAPQV